MMKTDVRTKLDGFRRFARGRLREWRPYLTGAAVQRRALMAAVRNAQSHERDGRIEESASLWKAIHAAHPDSDLACAGYGGVLRRLNRQAEAGAVLSDGLRRFPDDLGIRFELACVSQALGLMDETLVRAGELIARFPREPHGYLLAGQIHCVAQRIDEADAVLREGQRHTNGHTWLDAEYAIVADARGDWPEALARWERFRTAHPQAEIGYAGLGAAFKRLKRYEEAEAILAAGLARFPGDANIGINAAWLAEGRGDWAEALRRWAALSQLFPHDPRIRHLWIECQGKARIADVDLLVDQAADGAAPVPGVEAAQAAGPEAPHAALLLRFESLGENCELGFAQRHLGAEPIGLIRWAGIYYEQLLLGLQTGFAGVGSVESTEFRITTGNHEYISSDRTFGLDMHSFVLRDDANEERIYRKLRRRLAFLRDKLLEDLALAEKIFVFEGQTPRTDAELIALHAAARRYGPVAMLCIRLADADHAPGTVSRIGDGLMIGHLDKLGLKGTHWDISFDLWIAICETAAAMVDADAAGTAA